MIGVAKQWNPKQAQLKALIQKAADFDQGMKLVLELHSLVHTSEMSQQEVKTFEDELWETLDPISFKTMPAASDTTIAWNIWHITRIEDITANILIAGEGQVIHKDQRLKRLNVQVCDTGNAMTREEIIDFSSTVNMEELRGYRIAVGRRTRDIVSSLTPEDLHKKVEPARLQRILQEGGVLDVEGSRWLLDFWGRKNVAGILQMPITRHQVVHINDALKLKAKCMKNRGSSQ